MTYLLLQTFLLLLASYFLGAFLACLVKRMVVGTRAARPLTRRHQSISSLQPVCRSRRRRRRRSARGPLRPIAPPIAPRPIDPVQPRIDVLRRPEPRPTPKLD